MVASSSRGPLPCSILLLLDATLMLLPPPDSDLRVRTPPPRERTSVHRHRKSSFSSCQDLSGRAPLDPRILGPLDQLSLYPCIPPPDSDLRVRAPPPRERTSLHRHRKSSFSSCQDSRPPPGRSPLLTRGLETCSAGLRGTPKTRPEAHFLGKERPILPKSRTHFVFSATSGVLRSRHIHDAATTVHQPVRGDSACHAGTRVSKKN